MNGRDQEVGGEKQENDNQPIIGNQKTIVRNTEDEM